jgi:hypothetical protein
MRMYVMLVAVIAGAGIFTLLSATVNAANESDVASLQSENARLKAALATRNEEIAALRAKLAASQPGGKPASETQPPELAVAVSKEPREVGELAEFRQQYDKKVEIALAPVDTWAAQELRKLSKRLADKGALQEAILVRQELSLLEAMKPGGGLIILNASYGSSSRNIDVTEKVQGLVKAGRLSIANSGPLSFDSVFGDPHRGAVKDLTIVYRYDGRTRRVKVSNVERTDVSLP